MILIPILFLLSVATVTFNEPYKKPVTSEEIRQHQLKEKAGK